MDGQESRGRPDRSGSPPYPSILTSFTLEELMTDCNPRDENEYSSSASGTSLCLTDSSAESLVAHEHPLPSVLTQTDASWLLECSLRKNDRESDSTLEGNLSDSTSNGSLEDVIVRTEFIDQLKPGRFSSCLSTVPSVGLPTILAYKYESRENPLDYEALSPKATEILMQKVGELNGAEDYCQWTQSRTESIGSTRCQFCGKLFKLPAARRQMSEGFSNSLFCSQQCQDLSKFLTEEEEVLNMRSRSEVVDILPRAPQSNLADRQKAKGKMAMRLQNRTMEKHLKKAKEAEHKVTSGPKNVTTITFQLSTSLDVVKLKRAKEEVGELDNIFTEVVDDTFSWHKDLLLCSLVRNYRNGNKFLMTFSDGSAQTFYPSGNLAILMFIDKEKKITCVVQEDRDTDPAILAVFTSYGRLTCYHPNGGVWVTTNAFGGHYADESGARLRRWYWRNSASPLIFTPFKPIFISLNECIGVRIIEQQRILLTFLARGKQAKFNLGSILKLKTPNVRNLTSSWITEADLFLQTSWLKVQTVVNKLSMALNFPSHDPEKIALPLYLVSQRQKLPQLYTSIKGRCTMGVNLLEWVCTNGAERWYWLFQMFISSQYKNEKMEWSSQISGFGIHHSLLGRKSK
ncbi:glutamate-rich protein 6-like isoform X3 [Narcine bancroftii]|uniref:glutamate-rich protein 6-like isoform X3 n=1 Tax=Narcine bancroftii TaxID=1343680 RepID=UPI003831AB70